VVSDVAGGGGTDRLRVKIRDNTTGNVFYDNQMNGLDTADPVPVIRGGDIIVHG
jgi:hypothetical protein